MEDKKIPTAEECAKHGVTEEIKFFISLIGLGFHPDTDFKDYISGKGQRKINGHYVSKLNARLDEAFALCEKYNIDIYEICLDIIKPSIKE